MDSRATVGTRALCTWLIEEVQNICLVSERLGVICEVGRRFGGIDAILYGVEVWIEVL